MFIWKPTDEQIKTSNVWRFMQKHGISDYWELVRKSTKDVEWFWDEVVKDLEIEWFRPYEKVLDTSEGIPWAKWFIGGKINLTYNCVDRHARTWRRNKTALIWEGEDGDVKKLTYWELMREVNKAANALKFAGVKRGDTVGIFMPMSLEAVVVAFACAKVGAIYTPIFSGFGARAVADRLSDCKVKLLFTADGFLRRGTKYELKRIADDAVDMCPHVGKVVVLKRLRIPVRMRGKDIWWDEFVSGASLKCESEVMDSEDPFMVIYTSGTTGKPKGAVHVHGGFLVKIAEEVAYQVDLHDNDVLFWFTDMGWIMGPWEVVGGCALGGTILLYEGAPDYPKPDRIWDMVERHGITILGISPTAIRALAKYGDKWVEKHDLSSLRILGSTGEPWDTEHYMWYFKKVGQKRCPIINISGGTEVGACFLSPTPVIPLKPCTLAGPALGVDIDIFGEDGKSLKEGIGELVAKKPWPGMTRGIWEDPKRYVETYWSRWENVWVHGDWAERDEDGYWYLHGRSDDTIKVAGKRVGPAEIESAVALHPATVESAAVGIPHKIKGEAILIFVILKPEYKPSKELKEEIKETVAKELGKTMKPEDVKFVRQLPKTRSAKILRRFIKAAWLGQEISDLSSLENPSALDEIRKVGGADGN